jgi:hypothetical protein
MVFWQSSQTLLKILQEQETGNNTLCNNKHNKTAAAATESVSN